MAKRVVDSNEIEDALKAPLYIYPDRTDKKGDVSRRYLGDKATVNINPTTGVITTVWRTGSRLRKKYGKGIGVFNERERKMLNKLGFSDDMLDNPSDDIYIEIEEKAGDFQPLKVWTKTICQMKKAVFAKTYWQS